jgi:hypothetical protein
MPGPNAPWQASQRPWQAPHPGGQQLMPQQPVRASGLLRIAGSIGGSYLASALREAGRFLGRFGLR